MVGFPKHPDVAAFETFIANHPGITDSSTLGSMVGENLYLRNRLLEAFQSGISEGILRAKEEEHGS